MKTAKININEFLQGAEWQIDKAMQKFNSIILNDPGDDQGLEEIKSRLNKILDKLLDAKKLPMTDSKIKRLFKIKKSCRDLLDSIDEATG